MQFTVISSASAPHQLQHQEALAEGLRAHGIEPLLTNVCRSSTKYVACWGWRLGKALREQGHEVLVMERGYIFDRFSWSSLAWNGLNGFGDFGRQPSNSTRFTDNSDIKPWNAGEGKYVLILGQVPGDASLRGIDLMPWYAQKAKEAFDVYGLPVVFRPHPNAVRKGYNQRPFGTQQRDCDLATALKDAKVAITFNSNSAVDALLAGCPVLTFDKGSMAYAVTEHEIGKIAYHPREEWAYNLAWKQWQLNEIASGAALNSLLSVDHVRNCKV